MLLPTLNDIGERVATPADIAHSLFPFALPCLCEPKLAFNHEKIPDHESPTSSQFQTLAHSGKWLLQKSPHQIPTQLNSDQNVEYKRTEGLN